ncbi:MAG TPA: DNA-directed RNA polymerase subunit H [Nitrososphaerales archaeon]
MSEESKLDLKVSDHIYVPKHEIVPEENVGEILKKHNAKLEQFPYILVSDPIVKEIGGRPGDLIKISRKSPTAGEMPYYRFVVEG